MMSILDIFTALVWGLGTAGLIIVSYEIHKRENKVTAIE